MKLPAYLNTKAQVAILAEGVMDNRSTFAFTDNQWMLNGQDTVFLYLENHPATPLRLTLSPNAEIRLYMIFKTSMPSDYDITVEIGDHAHLDVFSVFRNTDRTTLSLRRAFHIKASGSLTLSNALLSMGETTLKETVHLEKPYAQVRLDQLNIGSLNDRYVVDQEIIHEAVHTTSLITNSLIANANAKLNYSVAGRIDKGNEYSNCRQTNKGIILGENGEIEVIPKLFIDEYNVEASHGAAIGQIDEDQLYYLQSRGMTETQARTLIISGYTKPFIHAIEDEDIKELVERQVLKTINEANIL